MTINELVDDQQMSENHKEIMYLVRNKYKNDEELKLKELL
jgi:hypothetical protein